MAESTYLCIDSAKYNIYNMSAKIIGRGTEIANIQKLIDSKDAEMLAVIGRRRVGKTFLVRSVIGKKLLLEITGIHNAKLQEQLQDFAFQLSKMAGNRQKLHVPRNWTEAFRQLSVVLEKKENPKEKQVLFYDELPWLASRKSGFLPALDHFWNTWAVKRNILIVICGSSASWMINKVIHHKGGLHNRVTKVIRLAPFTLAETKQYLWSRGVKYGEYQTALMYMVMGGIPHYLKEVEPGKSPAQNIDSICFGRDGLLYDEFSKLYAALFENAGKHIQVIRTLATKMKGLTRAEIVKKNNIADGGALTRTLTELMESGFISVSPHFNRKKKESLYRLTDEYSLFYLKYIEKQTRPAANVWLKISSGNSWKAWSGFAFENLCLKHITEVKSALGISGVYSEESSYFKRGDNETQGFQIDLLIDRNDGIINICEAKFSSADFIIDKKYASELRNKLVGFRNATGTKKGLMLTFITSFGLKNNTHSLGLVDHSITLADLFRDV